MQEFWENKTDEVFDITIDCLENGALKYNATIDIEAGSKFLNGFFVFVAVVTGGIFIYQISQGLLNLQDPDPENFTFQYANWGERKNYVGIITAPFLHGSVDHILWNLIFLYPMALVMDRIYGSLKSIGLFLCFGIFSGIGTFYLNGGPSIGASGAIFGIFGLITTIYVRRRNDFSENLRDTAWVLPIVGAYQIFLGFTNPMVDNVAHIVGYAGGIFAGFVLAEWSRAEFLSPPTASRT